jgi:cytochrome c biogenesis protein CcdA
MSAAFGFAYTAGVLAAFNPCGVAMLPAWIGYFPAAEDATRPRDLLARILRALWVAAAITAGFVVTIAAAAAVVDAGFTALNQALPTVDLILAAGLAGIGAAILTHAQLPGLRLHHPTPTRRRTTRGMFIYGTAYGVATIPCVLPIFLVAIGTEDGGTAVPPLLDRGRSATDHSERPLHRRDASRNQLASTPGCRPSRWSCIASVRRRTGLRDAGFSRLWAAEFARSWPPGRPSVQVRRQSIPLPRRRPWLASAGR